MRLLTAVEAEVEAAGSRSLWGEPVDSWRAGNLVGTPWLLERALPGAELLLVGDSGHTTATGSISEVLVGVLDRFARS